MTMVPQTLNGRKRDDLYQRDQFARSLLSLQFSPLANHGSSLSLAAEGGEASALVRYYGVVARGLRDVNLIKCRFLAAVNAAFGGATKTAGPGCRQERPQEQLGIYRCHDGRRGTN